MYIFQLEVCIHNFSYNFPQLSESVFLSCFQIWMICGTFLFIFSTARNLVISAIHKHSTKAWAVSGGEGVIQLRSFTGFGYLDTGEDSWKYHREI